MIGLRTKEGRFVYIKAELISSIRDCGVNEDGHLSIISLTSGEHYWVLETSNEIVELMEKTLTVQPKGE